MRLTIIPRTWMTPQGNVKTYAIKKDGLPYREFNESELKAFLRGVVDATN